ncbi:MAG: helicase HerA domain-containing protein [Thermoplasmata archaeon]
MEIDKIYSFIDYFNFENINGHGLVIGETGYGKTSFLKMVINKKVKENKRIIVLDPHGDISRNPGTHGIYINPRKLISGDKELCYRMNVMFAMDSNDKEKVQTVIDTLKIIFSRDIDYSNGTWGPRLDNIFTIFGNEIYDENPEPTLEDLFYKVIERRTDNIFFKNMSKYQYQEYIQSFINKINPVINNNTLKNFISSRTSMRFVFSNENLFFDFDKLHFGENSSRMMASSTLAILFNLMKFGIIKDSLIVIDEIKDFSPYLIPNLLSESRKYGIEILLATQYLSQMDKNLVDSILANSGYISIFRISPFDARIFSEKVPFNFKKFMTMTTNLPRYKFLIFNGELFKGDTVIISDNVELKNEYMEECIDNRNDILMASIIISLIDIYGYATEDMALREFENISKGDGIKVLRDLSIKNMILNKNGFLHLNKNGINLSENYIKSYAESIYHAYLIRRTSSFFISMGYDVKTSRPFENAPDIIAVKGNNTIFIEAEYGDLKNRPKLFKHLSNKNRVVFAVLKSMSWKLFCNLIEPFENYKNIKNLDDYLEKTWILSVPMPSERGLPEIYNPLKNNIDYDFRKSNTFKINNMKINEFFNEKLENELKNRKLTRCDYIKLIYKIED